MEESMRQPDVATLQAIIAALPDDRLRPLLLELLGVVSAAPSADADEHKPTDAASTTPTPPAKAKHAGGRPRGSPNKAKATAGATGAAQARHLAALPGREEIIRAVIAGELTQVAGAKKIGCTAKTLGTWVVRYRSEQQEPAATPTNGEGAAAHAPAGAREPAPQAAKPAPAKRSGPASETEAERTARLARHAAKQRERDAERRQRRDAERAAQAAQLTLPVGGNGNGEDAARLAISAARPAAAKPNVDSAAEAALAAKLWQHAAELNPTAPWKPIVAEFGLNAALALNHCRSGTMPPLAPAAASRFIEASAS
jgi:hypothetical protein